MGFIDGGNGAVWRLSRQAKPTRPTKRKINMKTKDILTITSAALGTAALTLVTFWPGPSDAGTEAQEAATRIAQPKLVCQDIELSLAHPGGQAIKAGDRPQFELTAVNTAKETRTAKVCATMSSSAPENRLSRTIQMPTELWHQEETLTLKAGETRVIPLAVTAGVPANSLVSVHLVDMVPGAPAIPEVPREIGPTVHRMPYVHEIVALNFSTMGETPSSEHVAKWTK